LPSLLRKRVWKIRVGDITTTELDATFDINKSIEREPNSCVLSVFNLSQEHRRELESLNIYDPKKSAKGGAHKTVKSGNIQVEVHAGYGESMSLLFRGFLRRAISTRDGSSWMTTIEGEDGGHDYYARRVVQSFPAGSTKLAVVRACAERMGVGLGNIDLVAKVLGASVYSKGTVVDGQADSELRRVLRAHGIRFSVQNGSLQFL